MIREDFLQQSAYSDTDSFCPIEKQYLMLKVIITYFTGANIAMERESPCGRSQALPLKAAIGRMKDAADADVVRVLLDDVGVTLSALEAEK